MTGEVTLTGRVLPVGGVREKILAARRAGIKTVLIPRHNEKDLVEIPAEVKSDVTLRAIDTLDDVVGQLFLSDRAAAQTGPRTSGKSTRPLRGAARSKLGSSGQQERAIPPDRSTRRPRIP